MEASDVAFRSLMLSKGFLQLEACNLDCVAGVAIRDVEHDCRRTYQLAREVCSTSSALHNIYQSRLDHR